MKWLGYVFRSVPNSGTRVDIIGHKGLINLRHFLGEWFKEYPHLPDDLFDYLYQEAIQHPIMCLSHSDQICLILINLTKPVTKPRILKLDTTSTSTSTSIRSRVLGVWNWVPGRLKYLGLGGLGLGLGLYHLYMSGAGTKTT
jgi:hypothetical protein